MKDNKKILSEIRRIHEIMGISKPLLNESILDDLFKLGAKNADEAILIGTKTVPNELAVAIRKASKQVDDGVKSVKNSLDDILEVARVSAPELVDELIERIVNHSSIVDTYISMIADAADKVKTLVDEGISLSDALKQVDEQIYGPQFKANKILPNEVYNKFLNDVIDEVDNYTPKTKPDGGTPKPDETPKPSETSIPNIEKSLNDIVDTIDDSEIEVINQKYTAWWGKTLERLKAATLPIFKGAETLQDAILRDIAIWQKTSPNARPVIRKRIIANLQELEAKNAELYEATQNWIDVEIRPMASKSPEVRNFYNKLQAKDGWPKVMILQNVFQGAGIGLRDVITNNKLLRGAWVKAMLKPFTIPTNIITGVINKIFNTNLSKVGKMSPEQWTAFKNWFVTTNPAGWEAVQQVFKNKGFIGGASYVTAQLIYRYFLVSTMIGVGRTLGALAAEGIDVAMGAAFDVDTDIADAAITNYLFGTSNLSEITQSLKDNPESSDLAHVSAIIDMIGKQSEPFRKWVGMWPAGTVGKATWDLIKLIQNGKLSEEIENLERESEDLQRQLESAADESGHPLPSFLGGNEEEGVGETTTGNNQPSDLSDIGVIVTDDDGDGIWKSEYGELFKKENNKWKMSKNDGETWSEI